MKYVDHFRLNMEREDREREQRFLESIGPIGRLADNNLYFCLTMGILMLLGFNIGFLIGFLL
jgi:hypothetical protein